VSLVVEIGSPSLKDTDDSLEGKYENKTNNLVSRNAEKAYILVQLVFLFFLSILATFAEVNHPVYSA